jgi:hypothetical protein
MSFSDLNSMRPSFQGLFGCTYGSASNQSPNAQYGFGGAVGLAFSSIADTNRNWNSARDNAFTTGNHWGLPNGTHKTGNTTIIKADTHIRYESSEHSLCHGITKDGIPYTYIK